MQRGDRIGNYEIEGELGATATCTIYRALHQVLPRRAVVKVVRAAGAWTRQRSVEALREACILEALHHPGVVRVFEAGRMADGRAWLASELVEGLTIAEALLQGPADPAVAAGMLRDAAEVLAHAHRRGVLHGGLAPEGVVVTGRTRGFPLCLVDWSHARTHDAGPLAPPLATAYLAPELLRGDPIDDRADVFSLGVIAYQALTGTLPSAGDPAAFEDAPTHVPAELVCPGAPRELTALVDQMLARDRWDRPSSGEVCTDLAWVADLLAPPPPRQLVRIRQPRWTPAPPYEHADDAVPVEEHDAPTGKLRRPT
jgi:serine/threonine-protein kinase